MQIQYQEKYYEHIHFEHIYNILWLPQVELGNMPERNFYSRCRCHPNINEEIIYNEIFFIKESKIYNEPNAYLLNITNKSNKVEWFVCNLITVYVDSIYEKQCYEDVKNLHSIYWNILNDTERKKVKYYADLELIWKDFSLLMCGLYKKSFEYIEKH